MNASTAPALRFLYVEDHSRNGERASQVIGSEWPQSVFKLTRSEDELMNAVEAERFDLVLWDFRQPDFSRLRAAVRKRTPDSPFLILAENRAEDPPMGAIELGTHDYLVTGGIAQLVPSVQRALRGIFLPPLQATSWGSQPPMPLAARSGRGETVLVIDDEKYIAEMIGTYLARFGYRPLVAASASAGVELMRTHAAEVGLVLTDMQMPGMPCDELLAALRRIRPEVKVVLMTGKPGSDASEKIATLGCCGFLPKPMTGHEIAQTVGSAFASEVR